MLSEKPRGILKTVYIGLLLSSFGQPNENALSVGVCLQEATKRVREILCAAELEAVKTMSVQGARQDPMAIPVSSLGARLVSS